MPQNPFQTSLPTQNISALLPYYPDLLQCVGELLDTPKQWEHIASILINQSCFTSFFVTRKLGSSHEIIFTYPNPLPAIPTTALPELHTAFQTFLTHTQSILITPQSEGAHLLALAHAQAGISAPIQFQKNIFGYCVIFCDGTRGIPSDYDTILMESITTAMAATISTSDTAMKVRSAQDKTQAIIESLVDGLLLFDSNEQVVMMNPAASDICDTPLEKVIGLTPDAIPSYQKNLLAIIHALPAFPDALTKPIEHVMIDLKEPYSRSLEISLSAMFPSIGEKKTPVGYVLTLRDVTKEKMVDQMKSEFVSVASHQLRTPLAAIKWSLQMLKNGDLGKMTNEQLEFITKCFDSNERMIKLVNDLLNVSRIEEGLFQYTFETTDAKNFIQLLLNENAIMAQQKNIILEQYNDIPQNTLIKIDADKLRMAIQNILDNAYKYTPAGGRVIVKTNITPDALEVKLSDTGVGIPDANKDKIFSKFFRASNVVKMQTEGSGLGLFIVKSIVERHHGAINFYSEEGHGTTFTITIPLHPESISPTEDNA
ncbi:MAG TPA: ATP-binding protein [Patescibacteria group bacterium]|nr:ATP-binding protein [Patescibacteria group bacterium]